MASSDRDHGSLPKLYSIFRGQVASLQPYGAFVKIPHTRKNGLVHKTQISKMKIDNPSEVLEVGDKVYCKVISLGEDREEKISLSMKVVNQDNGKDLDENLIITKQEELRRKKGLPPVQDKIELGAVLNTVCKKCGMKGHLTQDCFKLPGEKSYDLVPELDLESLKQNLAPRENKGKKKKKSKLKKKKKKENRASSLGEDTSSEGDRMSGDDRDRRKKEKKKKKKQGKEELLGRSSDSSSGEEKTKKIRSKEREQSHNLMRKDDSSHSFRRRSDSLDERDYGEYKHKKKRKKSYDEDERGTLGSKGDSGDRSHYTHHYHHYERTDRSLMSDKKHLKHSKYDKDGHSYKHDGKR